MLVPDRFSTRVFFIQHLAPYEYVKRLVKDKVVLDAGTSDGYGAYHLAEAARQVVGIDIDQKEIEKAQNSYKKDNLQFLVNSILDIKFPDEHFDMIFSSQVIEHIELDKLDKYLSEIYRVLKKTGVLFVSTLNLTHNLKGRSEKDYDKSPHHIKEFTARELKSFLSARFPKVEMLGLCRNRRHAFYNFLNKNRIFKKVPDKFNPVKKFYDNKVDLTDFAYSRFNIEGSLDLMAICTKI